MGAHSDENRRRTQQTAEEAGVEPTEDAWRPPTGLKPARVTGPDALPRPILQVLCAGSKVEALHLFRSGKYLAAAQHYARVTGPSGRSHLVEIFEDLDRQIAADAATFLEARGGEGAFG